MEYARKMVVLTPEELARFQEGVQTTGYNQLASLDGEMQRIMTIKNISDVDKWGLYKQVLNRYLHFAKEARQPLKVQSMNVEDESSLNKRDEPSVDLMKVQTLEAMPNTLKRKAEFLYDKLKSTEDSLISWDDKGVVSVHGVRLPGSSVTDLVSDAIRDRKKTSPVGWNEFLQVLSDLNIPGEFIGNTRRRSLINASHRGESTPRVLTPVKQKKRGAPIRSPRWAPYSFRRKI